MASCQNTKRRFTLIEITICLVILALIGTTATAYGYKMYKTVQHARSHERLIEEILVTKVLALTHQIDITLHFVQKGNKIVFTRTADYVPPKASSYFNRPMSFPCLELKEERTVSFYSNNPSSFEFKLDLN